MATRIALALLVLALAACGAGSSHVALGTRPSPATAASPSPGAAPSPRPTERILDIKIHYQEHNLTCEAAALKMALAYEGITVDEMTLVGYMTIDRRAAKFDTQGN